MFSCQPKRVHDASNKTCNFPNLEMFLRVFFITYCNNSKKKSLYIYTYSFVVSLYKFYFQNSICVWFIQVYKYYNKEALGNDYTYI